MGKDAVKKAKDLGTKLIEAKFPNKQVTDTLLYLTVNLEIKYEIFSKTDGIIQIGRLDNLQVLSK